MGGIYKKLTGWFLSQEAKQPHDGLSHELRYQLVTYALDVFQGRYVGPGMHHDDRREEFLVEVHDVMQRRLGRPQLSTGAVYNKEEDLQRFLPTCPSAEFFEFIEFMFESKHLGWVVARPQELVDEINDIFRRAGAPYQMSPLVQRRVPLTGPVGPIPFQNSGAFQVETESYPKVFRTEEELIFVQAVGPVLSLGSPHETEIIVR